MILLSHFEANDHQEGITREGLEEKFLVIDLHLPIDFPK